MNSFGWRVASAGLRHAADHGHHPAGPPGLQVDPDRRPGRDLLLTFDGLTFVMSRTALLDIFLAFFVVAAVGCLAADRDWFRNRLARPSGAPRAARSRRPVRSGSGGASLAASPPAYASAWPSAASGTRCTCWPRSHCCRWPGTSGRDALPAPEHAPSSRSCATAFRRSSPWSCSAWWSMSAPGPAGWRPPAATTATGAPTTRTHTTVRLLGEPLASLLHYQYDIWNFHTGDFINKAAALLPR